MEVEFSTVNLHYLLQARELARWKPHVAACVLGLPPDLVALFAELTPEQLVPLGRIKTPLVVARGESWWWNQLLTAVRDGQTNELDAVLEHAQLVLAR